MDMIEREGVIKLAEELGVKDAASLSDVQLRDAVEAARREKVEDEIVDDTPTDLSNTPLNQNKNENQTTRKSPTRSSSSK